MDKRTYYTGVGSRETPLTVQKRMTQLATTLYNKGFILRSGGADGADRAFEEGVPDFIGKEIYIPWKNFEKRVENEQIDHDICCGASREAALIAERINPTWKYLGIGGRKLHTRNVFQVLGRDLETPSKFLICWTSGGREVGGTRTAIVLAKEYRIPIYNLGDRECRDLTVEELLWKTLPDPKKE